MATSLSYCAEQVKAGDLDRYLAALFAPAPRREHLFALYAFNLEVTKIPGVVSEPMLGEIRLQWWRETVEGIYEGNTREHEVALALAIAIEAHDLPREGFELYLNAQQGALDPEPFSSLFDLQTYSEHTSSFLMETAANILSPQRDPITLSRAAKPGGIAQTISGVLSGLVYQARRRRCDLPGDVRHKHGVDLDALFAGHMHDGLRGATEELGQIAREHLATARQEIKALDPSTLPALLPLALIEPRLRRLRRQVDLLKSKEDLTMLSRQVRLLWHMARGRI